MSDLPEVTKPTVPLFVGYSVKAAAKETVDALMPRFEPSKLLEKNKAEADVAARQQAFRDAACNLPYVGQVQEIFLSDKGRRKVLQWVSEDGKSAAVRFRNSIVKAYGAAYADPLSLPVKPPIVFIGFDIARFLHLVAVECSLPGAGSDKALPLGMWCDPRIRIEVLDWLMPGCTTTSPDLVAVLQHRAPKDAESAAAWAAIVAGWTGPGKSPQKDTCIAVEIAAQFGLEKK